MGRLTDAVADARQSIIRADQGSDAGQRMINRATAADALHQSGQRAEAELIQKKRKSEFDLLHSQSGFRYCDWLMALAEHAEWRVLLSGLGVAPSFEDRHATICDEVERRGTTTLKWMIDNRGSLLDIALDHLTLARVGLIRAILAHPLPQPTLDFPQVAAAVNGLRNAGAMNHLPKGLLTAALYHFVRGDSASAHTALDQAQQIAERGPMPLYLADVHPHRARLFRDRSELAKARTLIEKHGYWRRKEELEDAEAAAKEW